MWATWNEMMQQLKRQNEQLSQFIQQKRREPVPVTVERKELLQKGSSISSSIPSSFTKSSRVFGKSMETEETVRLSNEELVQLQQDKMKNQDDSLLVLGKIVNRQKEIGIVMNRELEEQNKMLQEMEENVVKVNSKAAAINKRIQKIK